MPVEQAFRRIQRQLAEDAPVNVVLASRSAGEQEDDLRRLNITADLQQEFQRIAQDAVKDEIRLVPYEPGYKPDKGELSWIDLEQAVEIGGIVQRIANYQDLVIFERDDEFIRTLAHYALFARTAAQRGIVLFRKTSEKLELGRSRTFGAIFREGHYDRVEETMFLFDRNIDCWSDGRYMFIRNVRNFERIFRYFEQLQEMAQQTVDGVLERIPISNVEAFREACTTQVRFMTKLAIIAKKPYLAQVGMRNIRRAIREHELEIEIVREDGHDKLRFDPDPSKRWILLKLLDDDYLNSVMTHLKYEVNSKIAQAVRGD